MTAVTLDGARVAEALEREIRQEIRSLISYRRPPGLVVVLVGNDPASEVYVQNKDRRAREVGIRSETLRLPPDVSEKELLATLSRLNAAEGVDGILVQLPLPPHLDPKVILDSIDPRKDVDGFHPENQGLLLDGRPRFVPATAGGILELLRREKIEVSGKDVVVIGRSPTVGRPLAVLLFSKGVDATVTVCHTMTADVRSHARRADILVVAAGRAGLVDSTWIKPGAVVVDVGIHRVPDPTRRSGYRIVGDVRPEVAQVAGALTPVPGGVGPMTIAMLLKNTLLSAKMRG